MEGKKTGGRAAGVPNKRTMEALEVFGEFCPLEKILERLKRPNIKDDLFIGTCLKLLEYKFPKRKAVEHTLDLGNLPDDELFEQTINLINNYRKKNEE